jgi:hypothetical protein
MNWKLPLLAVTTLTALSLVSCITPGRGVSKDGTSIYYPTVSDMERFETQHGTGRKSAPTQAPSVNPSRGAYVPSVAPDPGSAPATVPLEAVQPDAPPTIPPSLR